MLASIALAGGVRDWTFLQSPLSRPTQKTVERGHVHHAIARMPDEPRFRLARAVALSSRQPVMGEMETARDGTRTSQIPNPLVRVIEAPSFVLSGLEQRRTTLIEYSREELEKPGVRAGSWRRSSSPIGLPLWARGEAEPALATLRAAGESARIQTSSTSQIFWRRRPHRRSAIFALRKRTTLRRSRTSALAVGDARALRRSSTFAARPISHTTSSNASRSGRPRDDDPWRMFFYGDFPKLPALVDELRRVVRP